MSNNVLIVQKENKFASFPVQIEVGGNIIAGFNTCAFEENSTNCGTLPHWIDLIDGAVDKNWAVKLLGDMNLPTRILMGDNWLDARFVFHQLFLKRATQDMEKAGVLYCFSMGIELDAEI